MPLSAETRSETAHRKYVAVLAFVAAGILGAGVALRPKEKPAAAPVSETEMVRLERLAQRRGLEGMAAYFSGVAADASEHLVRLKGTGATGIVWDVHGLIVVPEPLAVTGGPLTVTGDRVEAHAAVVASPPGIEVTGLRAPPVFPPVSTIAPESLDAGAWVVQVSRRTEGAPLFAPGVYSGATPARCGDFRFREVRTSLPPLRGSALFDLDGNLAAVTLRCGERDITVAAVDMNPLLHAAGTLDGQLLSRYGMRVAALDDAGRAYFAIKAGGLLVTEVWKGRPDDIAGLEPGDVLVNLEGAPVEAPADMQPLLADAPVFHLDVRRGKRKLSVKLAAPGSAELSGEVSSNGGLAFEGPRGIGIENVEAGSRAAQAGIRPGDRLLATGGRPARSLAVLRRAFSSGARTYLVLQRGPRTFGVFLNP